jgi:ABC-2 type transport system permease protein
MNSHPLAQLVLTRIREFWREPEAVFWATLFPVLLAVGLGIAFAERPEPILKVAAASPEIARALKGQPGLDVRELGVEDARRALRDGQVALVAERGDSGGAVYRFDNTNPEGRAARALVDSAVQRAAGRQDPVPAADAITREPGSRYIDFLVPGLIGVGIMSNAVWGIGFSIVDTRRRKLTKRLMATPMSRTHYLASYLIWRMIVLVIEVAIPLGFGALAFGVPVRGHLIDIAALSVLGSLTLSSIGLLIASRAKTIEAVSGLANLVIMPMWIVSGVFFSAQRFPDVVQPLIRLLPLTALIDALRGVILQGHGLAHYGRELVTLTGWLVVCFGVAIRIFRWK